MSTDSVQFKEDNDFLSFWSDAVVEAVGRRDLVVFMGAGVTMNSDPVRGKSPVSWANLLRECMTAARLTGKDSDYAEKLISAGRLLEAAEMIVHVARNSGHGQDVYTRIKTVAGGPGSGFGGNEWHDALLNLNSSIYITTNYDKSFTRASKDAFVKKTHDSREIGFTIRSGAPILIHMHGDVDNIESIILTQTDYSRMGVENSHVLEVIRALLLTRTVLFVGYSLTDPDVQLVLQNAVGGRNMPGSHYMLVPARQHTYEAAMFRNAFGVEMIEYPEGNHEYALEALRWLGTIAPV